MARGENIMNMHVRHTVQGGNFHKFKVLWLFAKVFSVNFGGVTSFGGANGSNSCAIYESFYTNSQNFSPPVYLSTVGVH